MSIQVLNSKISNTYKPILKMEGSKSHVFCYHDFLRLQGQCSKKSIDNFLQFKKISPAQSFFSALKILEQNPVEKVEDCIVEQNFDQEERTSEVISSDGTVNYQISYDGDITIATNLITGEIHLQQTDERGRLIREVFPCGLEISWKFDGDYLSEIVLPDQSAVSYQYMDPNNVIIQRFGADKNIQYQHVYNPVNDNLLKETLIGKAGLLQRLHDKATGTLTTQLNNLCVIDQFDDSRNLTSRTFQDLSKGNSSTTMQYPVGDLLVSEDRLLDDQGRVTHYNGYTCSYDEKGRLIQKISSNQAMSYRYDALDRLSSIEVDGKKIKYTYDIVGRRLSKTVTAEGETSKEFYIYQGVNQTGVYNEAKKPIHQKVLGIMPHTHLPLAIAIESKGKVYAPIYNSNYNVMQLIDKDTQDVIHYEELGPFGDNLNELNPNCPWIFAAKYYDQDTGLIDFGNRQYDPSIKQWTSEDPDLRTSKVELYSLLELSRNVLFLSKLKCPNLKFKLCC